MLTPFSKWEWLLFMFLLVLLPLLFTGVTLFSLEPWTSFHLEIKSQTKGARQHVKHTHLVQGHAAGQGLAGRVQCEGFTAGIGRNNTEARDGSCLASNREVVSFVTFFVQHNEEVRRQKKKQVADSHTMKVGNLTLRQAERHSTVLSIFLESIQISMPSNVKIVLSDRVSHISTNGMPMNTTIYRTAREYSRNNLMLERLESYIEFLEKKLASKMEAVKHEEVVEHIILMDSDIIVVGDLGCVFKNYTTFDIAFTFRNNKDQPINSGVIMIRGQAESIMRAINFLTEVVTVYRSRFTRATKMLGDQLSLAWIVQSHSHMISLKFKKPASFEAKISSTQVLFLPAQIYNWTPSEGAGQFHGMPEEVKVLHFKGSRKRLMIEAWNFYKQSQTGLSDLKCLILRSGRAKYDF